jgi:uncharacterized protein (TIGR02145 family)
MYKKILKTSVLITTVVIVFSSCSKDDDDTSSATNGKSTAVFNSSVTYGTMTDQDGNVYKTVTIGTQIWMAENLRTTKYNDGSLIPNVTNNSGWAGLSTGAYCNYKNTSKTDTIATFGRLYNWYAVNTGKLAPKGWHVPTDEEWAQLIDYVGDDGGKLKETDTTHWNSPNPEATNETGFTALPGGGRNSFAGAFSSIGDYGYWWSTKGFIPNGAYGMKMFWASSSICMGDYSAGMGCSVRCVKD